MILLDVAVAVKEIYLCVNKHNYCGAVFTTRKAADEWCAKYVQYHVITRPLNVNTWEVR